MAILAGPSAIFNSSRFQQESVGHDKDLKGDADDEYRVSEAEEEHKGDKESVTPHSELEYTKIKVAASEFYEDNHDSILSADGVTAMTVVPFKEVITTSDDPLNYLDMIAALVVEFMPKKPVEKDNQRYPIQSSGKTRERPQVRPEDKECLATWTKVGGLRAWTLWDSSSTTSRITPQYAKLAKIIVDTLEDLHVLQLGTVGS